MTEFQSTPQAGAPAPKPEQPKTPLPLMTVVKGDPVVTIAEIEQVWPDGRQSGKLLGNTAKVSEWIQNAAADSQFTDEQAQKAANALPALIKKYPDAAKIAKHELHDASITSGSRWVQIYNYYDKIYTAAQSKKALPTKP